MKESRRKRKRKRKKLKNHNRRKRNEEVAKEKEKDEALLPRRSFLFGSLHPRVLVVDSRVRRTTGVRVTFQRRGIRKRRRRRIAGVWLARLDRCAERRRARARSDNIPYRSYRGKTILARNKIYIYIRIRELKHRPRGSVVIRSRNIIYRGRERE